MLTINIFSFSYKKSGIPKDTSGNMGGFVFDCRCINNPAREINLMHLTGLDKEVIEYLEQTEEMTIFLKNVYSVINLAISNYLSRDFTNLMISFGCTGGQHRSVFAAEKLNQYLSECFRNKIRIILQHTDIPKN
jgi:RNase adaptor protein for sRNA GlmZ degradation